MKKSFLTGLIILLPVVLTAVILVFIINLLTAPFQEGVESFFVHVLQARQGAFSFFNEPFLITLISKLFILLFIFLGTLLIGFLGQLVFFHYILQLNHWLFCRIPLLNKVYKATQEVMNSLFKENKNSYSAVALVPFPHEGAEAMGFVAHTSQEKEGYTSIFLPGPNPTIGFMLHFRPDQITLLDMSIEEGFKFILSGGVLQTSKEEES